MLSSSLKVAETSTTPQHVRRLLTGNMLLYYIHLKNNKKRLDDSPEGEKMIYREPVPFKNLGLWLLLVCGGLITAYIIFIALISIYVGINHVDQDGFWMPVLVGIVAIMAVLWLFYSFLRFIFDQMKEKDIIKI